MAISIIRRKVFVGEEFQSLIFLIADGYMSAITADLYGMRIKKKKKKENKRGENERNI